MKPIYLQDNGRTIYEQVYEHVRNQIIDGTLPTQSKLPSKRYLSEMLGISLNSVARAYQQLIEEGYVVAEERRGYFVSEVQYHIEASHSDASHAVYSAAEKPQRARYDFSFQNVSHATFPFQPFRKIYSELFNEASPVLLEQSTNKGDERLRRAIAAYLRDVRDLSVSADRVIIRSGTGGLLETCMLLMREISTDMCFGIENPGYQRFNKVFEHAAVRHEPIAVFDHGIDLAALNEKGVTCMYCTPSHQFPTGRIMPIGGRQALLEWARTSNAYIIEDDYDSTFKYSGLQIPSLKRLDVAERVIYFGNFSKSVAPSLRVSYMVLPETLLGVYDQLSRFQSCHVDVLVQQALAIFIETGAFERHLNKHRTVYKQKRELMIRAIRQHDPEARISGTEAGMFLTVRPTTARTAGDVMQDCRQAGLAVSQMAAFYFDETERRAAYQQPPVLVLGFSAIDKAVIEPAIALLYNILRSS